MAEERKLGGFSLFTLWIGAAISLAEIMTGSLIAPIGIKKGIVVILVGHLIGCLILALIGVIGFREKKPSLVSSRISLGIYGSYIVSILNVIQLIGWTAIMLIQSARSMQAITENLFGINNFVVPVIITGVIVGAWALFADKGINMMNNIAVVFLLILSFVMLGALLSNGQAQQVTDSVSVGAALELSIVMPLTWLPLISDYTMAAKSTRGSFLGSFLGYFLGSSFMYVIGLVSAVYAGTSDPISILGKLNMALPALLIIILSTVTTTFLDVYSAALSTLNLTNKISRKKLIAAITVLGMLLALYFPMEDYEGFLYMIGSVFAPIFSVIIIDYFIYKMDRSDKLVNGLGIISAAIGTASYYLIMKYDLIIGLTMPSMIVTAVSYIIMRYFSNILNLEGKRYAEQNS